MFDTTGTLVANAFSNAWYNCALTAQSIENILVSLDTNGATGITLGIDGPNNAHTSTWSAAANAAWLSLDAKGWAINQNGPDPVAPALTYGITNAGGVFNLRSTGTVDYEVEWGDGNAEVSTLNTLQHTYTAAGDYSVVVYSDGVYRPYNPGYGGIDQVTSVAIGSGADLGTNLDSAWEDGRNLATFTCPFNATSSVTNFRATWARTPLTIFPLIDTSLGTNFHAPWYLCTSLVSFPSLNMSSGTDFSSAWFTCTSLATFPANMFDTTGTLICYCF